MPHDNLDLSALIGSRICHDLISPIGAISNGLELLQMGLPRSPEMALMADSVGNATARVRYFRVAFGKASSDQHVNLSEITGILRDLSSGARISITWDGTEPPDRAGLRAAFLGAMCLETALPLGGDIVLGYDGTGWDLRAAGRRIQMPAALWDRLADASPDLGNISGDISPGHVQFALLPSQLHQMGRRAEVTSDDTTARLRF